MLMSNSLIDTKITIMLKSVIKITCKPGLENYNTTPQLKIANKHLSKFGFQIGDFVEVEYLRNKIIIRKVKNKKVI